MNVDPFDDIAHYEFYRTDTGEVVAEKYFFARSIEQVMPDDSVLDHAPEPIYAQVSKFKAEFCRNMGIDPVIVKSRAV